MLSSLLSPIVSVPQAPDLSSLLVTSPATGAPLYDTLFVAHLGGLTAPPIDLVNTTLTCSTAYLDYVIGNAMNMTTATAAAGPSTTTSRTGGTDGGTGIGTTSTGSSTDGGSTASVQGNGAGTGAGAGVVPPGVGLMQLAGPPHGVLGWGPPGGGPGAGDSPGGEDSLGTGDSLGEGPASEAWPSEEDVKLTVPLSRVAVLQVRGGGVGVWGGTRKQ